MKQAGKHFLQIPGPTNVPDSVLRAISDPTIDHRGPEFSEITLSVISGLKKIVKGPESIPIIFPSSGTGAWEAALVNVLSEGEKILKFKKSQQVSQQVKTRNYYAEFFLQISDLGVTVEVSVENYY